ncbi:unnamed protein product [Auanema sp. JU1783]|nr:unnamed protein product [Auanema sp. JU1783]
MPMWLHSLICHPCVNFSARNFYFHFCYDFRQMKAVCVSRLCNRHGMTIVRDLKRYTFYDVESRVVLDASILQYVRELEVLLQNPNVRGNLDPTMRLPVVDEDSTVGVLLKRMKNQIKAVCVLSDVVYIDPPANPNENDTIARARRIVNLLYDAISPPSSACGSGYLLRRLKRQVTAVCVLTFLFFVCMVFRQ